MKFSQRTIQILRNFSIINQSIIFKPGNQVRTMSPAKTIVARANIDCEIERLFAIYDLSRFLGAVALFNEPDLETREKSVVIGSGSERLNYVYSDPSLIMSPPNKEIILPSEDVVFDLSNDILSKTQKALGVIGAPEIAITGDGTNIHLEALNTKDQSVSNYKIAVGNTDKIFKMVFLPENIKVLPNDYVVTLSSKGISNFKSVDVEYWIVAEAHSEFN